MFDEKCWAVEEMACRKIYDIVWDQKCESVNVTVQQRDCESREEAQVCSLQYAVFSVQYVVGSV